MSDNPYVGWAAASDDDEAGAFAVPTEVTWNNGFGDEDLAGASPARAKPAPRPAPAAATHPPVRPAPTPSLPAPAPVQPAPAAQARPLVADTEVPEWAAYRPSTTVPAQTPPAAVPPAPAQMPAPAQPPVRPASDFAEPEWAQHRPAAETAPAAAPTPVSTPVPAPHVPAPAPYLPTPDLAHAPEPAHLPEPVAAQPVPMPVREPDPMTQPVYTPDPQPEPESRTRRGKAKAPKAGKPGKGAKAAKGPKPSSPGKGMAGGRWKIKALRVAIYSLVGLLLLGGLKNIVAPSKGPDAQAITEAVRANIGDNGFPTDAAEGFAVRFASIYLDTDPNTQEDRLNRLAVFSPDAADGSWGWTGSVGKQSIIAGPVVASKPVLKDKNFATVTVTAQVTSKAWVYLAVPVYASNTGNLVVSGPPAFVAPPARADSPGDDAITTRDDALEQTLGTALMPGFFKAWAASNSVELDRYTAKDATQAARNGLAGAMTLDKVGEITMPRDGENTRVGEVEVTWNIKGAGTYIQNYVVTVTKDASAKWSVKDITGGVISDGAASTDGSPTATATETP